MHALTLNKVTHHYQLSGDPAATTLVFINSLGTDMRIWQEVITALQQDYRILCYDKRGHGLSACPSAPWSIADFAEDLLGLLEQLKINKAVFIGLSVGGMIALELAQQHPQRVQALLLADTAHKIGSAKMWHERIALIQQHGISHIADAVLQRWFSPHYLTSASAMTALWRAMLTRMPAEAYTATCAAIAAADYTDVCPQITCPVRCVCGEDDGATPPQLVQAMAALMPQADFVMIDKAGHLPCIEHPQVFTHILRQFLQEQTT